MHSTRGREIISGHVKGVAQSGVDLADLRWLPTPIPPPAEQRKMVEIIEQHLARIGDLAAHVTLTEQSASSLSQSILAKAFRGELVPQNQNDEFASVLLERIREERAAATTTKKKRKSKE